jgi:hypothetical protein
VNKLFYGDNLGAAAFEHVEELFIHVLVRRMRLGPRFQLDNA